MFQENATHYYPRYGHHRRDAPYMRHPSWLIPYRSNYRTNRVYPPPHLPNVPPPYAVHENLWYMQQSSQEQNRRLSYPLNLTTNHSRPCPCERRPCMSTFRRRPCVRDVSIIVYLWYSVKISI